MTLLLYLDDCYLKEFTATVTKVDGNLIYLDQTVFYPHGGGQPHDTGKLTINGTEYPVVKVTKTENGVAHEVDKEGIAQGDTVTGMIDWERRYKLMRMHTASHALSAIMHDKVGAKITGHGLDVEKTKIDFDLETFDRELLTQVVTECNEKLAEGHDVSFSTMDREEALSNPSMVKLARVLPPQIKTLRITAIEGIDRQADGGTHVKNTTECGTIEILKLENKGKGRKRVYITLKP